MRTISEYISLAEAAVSRNDRRDHPLTGLYAPIAYGLSGGGKRLRPLLLLMSAESYGENVEECFAPAAGIEMFHNFTLLHDDVMDNSDMRRGRPSVYAKWGINTAILSGDTMLTLATQLIADVEDLYLRRVLDEFNNMAILVYEGQQEDMEFEARDEVSMSEYISMVEKKTGALLGASAAIGSIIGGATEKDVRALYNFGLQLGVAFQIQDDLLDVFGNEATFGKPIGGDINNNKKTYLSISVLEQNDEISRRFRESMEMTPGKEKIAKVTEIYRESGILQRCREEIEGYCIRALESLHSTALPPDAMRNFEILVEDLLKRNK